MLYSTTTKSHCPTVTTRFFLNAPLLDAALLSISQNYKSLFPIAICHFNRSSRKIIACLVILLQFDLNLTDMTPNRSMLKGILSGW
mmetsp:Transcript_30716/g.36517  ORF Transcript_30716/g.36517 Transcript_30716/m.36517 type:complete len:86 (+) Transcript_30716:859-1116(+)